MSSNGNFFACMHDLKSVVGNGVRGGTLPVTPVGQPYPPCTISLSELRPMKISDLKMDTNHCGKKLTVKRASPVVTLPARFWTMVQEKKGEQTERLEVLLHKSRFEEDMLEFSKGFVVKEPYFTVTEQGEATLRVEHLLDLVVVHEEKEINGDLDAAAAERITTRFRNEGNAALKKQELPEAYAQYTVGLKVAKQETLSNANPGLAQDISPNRAYVNLLLNQLYEAIADAKSSLLLKDDQRSLKLDAKAYYLAGLAAYNLGHFTEAKSYF